MALVKSPTMTDKKLTANRRNQARSHGPKTEEGKERIRAGRLRHGVYSQAETAALRCLGEDPGEFQELLAGLCQEFTPHGSLEETLVVRLARGLWLMERADRSQEGYALRQARRHDHGRENRSHALMMRLRLTVLSLQSLAESVAHEHYVTVPKDLDLMKGLQQEQGMEEMGDIALALFEHLQDPGAVDEAGRPTDTYEAQAKVLMRIKEIFGVADSCRPELNGENPALGQEGASPNGDTPDGRHDPKPDPYPHITAEQWEAREPIRQLLQNILTHQAEYCEAKRQEILKESVKGLSAYERAAEVAPIHQEGLLLRRMQDANFREVRRITNLLLKIEQRGRRRS